MIGRPSPQGLVLAGGLLFTLASDTLRTVALSGGHTHATGAMSSAWALGLLLLATRVVGAPRAGPRAAGRRLVGADVAGVHRVAGVRDPRRRPLGRPAGRRDRAGRRDVRLRAGAPGLDAARGALAGAAPPRGADRRPHRPAQPPRAVPRAGGADRRGRVVLAPLRAAAARPRRLQGAQRHARPPRRRRPADRGLAAAGGGRARARWRGWAATSSPRSSRRATTPARSPPRSARRCTRRSTSRASASRSTRSVGIAHFPQDAHDSRELARRADVAMYDAKRLGTVVAGYTAEHDEHSLDRLALAADLRNAFDRDELWLAFQPQVDIATGRISGAEALIRWRHPSRGEIPPGVLLPIAERTGPDAAADAVGPGARGRPGGAVAAGRARHPRRRQRQRDRAGRRDAARPDRRRRWRRTR